MYIFTHPSKTGDRFARIDIKDLDLDVLQFILIEIAALNMAGLGPYSVPLKADINMNVIYSSLFNLGSGVSVEKGRYWAIMYQFLQYIFV